MQDADGLTRVRAAGFETVRFAGVKVVN